MPVGVTREHLELGSSIRAWAVELGGTTAVRESESDVAAAFAKTWQAVVEMGLTGIAIEESQGGGGGDLLDQVVAVEAASYGLVPGPILSTTVVAQVLARTSADDALADLAAGGRAALALTDTLAVGAVDARWLLARHDGAWRLLDADDWSVEPVAGPDLSDRGGRVTVSGEGTALDGVDDGLVRRVLVTVAAAEASGVAQWCLDTAVAYAKLREQFGAPIGSFQAVKHLCAEMLESTESIAAAAWDAAVAAHTDQADFAADVAAVVALDGAVSVAQTCIQVLGGIGFTFEHDAHLYLRRAVALRGVVGALTGGGEQSAARLAR